MCLTLWLTRPDSPFAGPTRLDIEESEPESPTRKDPRLLSPSLCTEVILVERGAGREKSRRLSLRRQCPPRPASAPDANTFGVKR